MSFTHETHIKRLHNTKNSSIISTYQSKQGKAQRIAKMNYSEYYTEVEAIAEALVSEAMAEHDNDAEQAMDNITGSRFYETIDGHQWVIYYNYNLSIIEHSSNDGYMIDNIGLDSAGHALQSGGLNGLHQAIAFWALYADVYELLQDKMDDYVDTLDTEE